MYVTDILSQNESCLLHCSASSQQSIHLWYSQVIFNHAVGIYIWMSFKISSSLTQMVKFVSLYRLQSSWMCVYVSVKRQESNFISKLSLLFHIANLFCLHHVWRIISGLVSFIIFFHFFATYILYYHVQFYNKSWYLEG